MWPRKKSSAKAEPETMFEQSLDPTPEQASVVEEVPKKEEKLEIQVEKKEEPTDTQPAEQVWPKSSEKEEKEVEEKVVEEKKESSD